MTQLFASILVHDIMGGGAFNWRCGEVTDDTQMAMCVMKAVMDSEANSSIDLFRFADLCKHYFVNWYDSDPKDIGGTCARGIQMLKCGKNPRVTSSIGNGGLMRAWPLAVIDELPANFVQNDLTYMNQICDNAIEKYHNTMRSCLIGTRSRRSKSVFSECMSPTGSVVNTLHNALYYLHQSNKFEDGIIWPVNDGGDSDTIACVTGSLVGAYFGYKAIPERWIKQLDSNVKEILDEYINWCCRYLERKRTNFVD